MLKSTRVKLGDLSVGFVDSLADAMRHCAEDPQPLLDSYGLDAARLAEPRARLSIPRYMRLGHSAIQQCGEPGLGLLMGQTSRLSQLGLAGVTAMQAPTVREAARALIRFEPLYASNYRGQSSLHEDVQGAWLRFYSISPYNAYNRFVVDSVLAGWLAQLSGLVGVAVQAERMEIEFCAPAYADRYQALCSSPVQFGATHNQLRLDRASLALRNTVMGIGGIGYMFWVSPRLTLMMLLVRRLIKPQKCSDWAIQVGQNYLFLPNRAHHKLNFHAQ